MKTLLSSIKITLLFGTVLFAGYVLVLWGIAAIIKPNHGQAEVIKHNATIVGAVQIGQSFSSPIYFWGRPSAVNYNAGGSGGSNNGPSNPAYLEEVSARIDTFLIAHPYLSRQEIPSEMITASASGLDPHLSPEAVAIQIRRVAKARSISEARIKQIIAENTVNPSIGKPYIHLLKLNVALDRAEIQNNKNQNESNI